jgi:hypothetical protein
MLKKSASIRTPLFGLFGLSRLFEGTGSDVCGGACPTVPPELGQAPKRRAPVPNRLVAGLHG